MRSTVPVNRPLSLSDAEGLRDDDARGAYVAWYLRRESSRALHAWCTQAGVRQPVPVGEHHCTVMYSPDRGIVPALHGDWRLPRPWHEVGYTPSPGGIARHDVLGPSDKPGALVLVLDSPVLAARNRFYRDEYGLQANYPDYLPHVTLSYAFDKQDAGSILRMMARPVPVPLVFDREHVAHCD